MFRHLQFFCALMMCLAIAHAGEVTVAVASNFSAPMQKIAQAFEQETGHKALLSFASTGNLYAQIRNGAPYQVLLAADEATPRKLEAEGLAYQSSSGDVNFAVRLLPDYGRLSGKSLDELNAGERVAVTGGKRDPLDFVLWKSAKPEEPADTRWASPWGEGRPGWHIECSAMATALLGKTLDIHVGGVDNMFPHHENEIAQSECATGHMFVKYWMHNEWVLVDQKKMAKSFNNFYTLRDLIEKVIDPIAYRFWLLMAN